MDQRNQKNFSRNPPQLSTSSKLTLKKSQIKILSPLMSCRSLKSPHFFSTPIKEPKEDVVVTSQYNLDCLKKSLVRKNDPQAVWSTFVGKNQNTSEIKPSNKTYLVRSQSLGQVVLNQIIQQQQAIKISPTQKLIKKPSEKVSTQSESPSTGHLQQEKSDCCLSQHSSSQDVKHNQRITKDIMMDSQFVHHQLDKQQQVTHQQSSEEGGKFIYDVEQQNSKNSNSKEKEQRIYNSKVGSEFLYSKKIQARTSGRQVKLKDQRSIQTAVDKLFSSLSPVRSPIRTDQSKTFNVQQIIEQLNTPQNSQKTVNTRQFKDFKSYLETEFNIPQAAALKFKKTQFQSDSQESKNCKIKFKKSQISQTRNALFKRSTSPLPILIN